MSVDNVTAREIQAMIDSAKTDLMVTIRGEVARVEGRLEGHREDRYAHGPAREQGQKTVDEWQVWRTAVDKQRYMMMGALALIGLESTAIGLFVAIHSLMI